MWASLKWTKYGIVQAINTSLKARANEGSFISVSCSFTPLYGLELLIRFTCDDIEVSFTWKLSDIFWIFLNIPDEMKNIFTLLFNISQDT